MGIGSWYDSKLKKIKWYEIGLIKLAFVFFGLLIAKIYTPALSLEWYWYAAVIILASIPAVYRIFRK